MLIRTHRKLVSTLIPQSTLLAGFSPPTTPADLITTTDNDSNESIRAVWQIFHYLSILSITILLPIVFLSGEIGHMSRNCYFLDLPFFWFLNIAAGLLGSAIFLWTFLLVLVSSSPFFVTFLSVPRSVIQLLILSRFHMPLHSWIGLFLSLLASLWFLIVCWSESRRGGDLLRS